MTIKIVQHYMMLPAMRYLQRALSLSDPVSRKSKFGGLSENSEWLWCYTVVAVTLVYLVIFGITRLFCKLWVINLLVPLKIKKCPGIVLNNVVGIVKMLTNIPGPHGTTARREFNN